MNAFAVTRWNAWAPGLDTADAWRHWAAEPQPLADPGKPPACDFLPAMQRRRLSPMARMCMHAAWPLCDDGEQLPFVFGSRHGETTRVYKMLGDIADGEPLSPTQFGLSVHNAIAGQWSILRGQLGESVAIAGDADTFEDAVLEAVLLLLDAPAVIVVVAEEKPPAAYERWIDDVPFSHALALRLETPRSDNAARPRWQLSLAESPLAESPHDTPTAPSTWPHALTFLQALLGNPPTLQTRGRARQWNWQQQG